MWWLFDDRLYGMVARRISNRFICLPEDGNSAMAQQEAVVGAVLRGRTA